MATETVDRRASHIRSVTVTSLAAVAGVLAAVASSALASGPNDPLGLYVLAGFIVVQFPILRVAGIDVAEFSPKDYLFVAFMSFALWFVCWTVLLTTGTTF
jgi:hypothetical protein